MTNAICELKTFGSFIAGIDNTSTLSQEHLRYLHTAVAMITLGLLSTRDSFQVIVDAGCSSAMTGYLDDYEPGTVEEFGRTLACDQHSWPGSYNKTWCC